MRERTRRRRLRQETRELRDAEGRALVARAAADTRSVNPTALARATGLPRARVAAYLDQSLERLRTLGPRFHGSPRDPEDLPRRPHRRGPGPGPHVMDPERPLVVYDGEVLDPPDEAAFKKLAFDLRKRALPFSQIAEVTGRSENECRMAVKAVLRSLEGDELEDTALAKRMMLEQLDSMIAAITVPATGRDINGNPHEVAYEAIDRMVKLLGEKAKLLGLHAPQRTDINHRIEVLAQETGYDIEELREIAQDVLRAYSARSLR